MKSGLIIAFIFISVKAFSQADDSSYTKMLSGATEISLADSLLLTTNNWDLQRLDSHDVKKWFSNLLGNMNNNRLKNRSYFLAGKITAAPNFDLLLILENKRKRDSSESQVLHLITTKKEGKYISSQEVAVTGTKKASNFNTSTVLFSDFSIRKNVRFSINEKLIENPEHYKINSGGRFILQQSN